MTKLHRYPWTNLLLPRCEPHRQFVVFTMLHAGNRWSWSPFAAGSHSLLVITCIFTFEYWQSPEQFVNQEKPLDIVTIVFVWWGFVYIGVGFEDVFTRRCTSAYSEGKARRNETKTPTYQSTKRWSEDTAPLRLNFDQPVWEFVIFAFYQWHHNTKQNKDDWHISLSLSLFSIHHLSTKYDPD